MPRSRFDFPPARSSNAAPHRSNRAAPPDDLHNKGLIERHGVTVCPRIRSSAPIAGVVC
jgi:hypothetical protein